MHFLHLCVVTFFTGFLPRHLMWWATMLCSIFATIAMAMWGCQWRELRPINFGGNGGRTTGNNTTAEDAHTGGDPDGGGMGDEEMGFGRGRGRGRGREGAGEYELASIREQEGN